MLHFFFLFCKLYIFIFLQPGYIFWVCFSTPHLLSVDLQIYIIYLFISFYEEICIHILKNFVRWLCESSCTPEVVPSMFYGCLCTPYLLCVTVEYVQRTVPSSHFLLIVYGMGSSLVYVGLSMLFHSRWGAGAFFLALSWICTTLVHKETPLPEYVP